MTILIPGGKQVMPGDFGVVRTIGNVGTGIRYAQRFAMLARYHKLPSKMEDNWEHAIFYADTEEDLILEAEPGGAKLVPFHYDSRLVMWSTQNDSLYLTSAQRSKAREVAEKYRGVPYSFLDYVAIGVHSLHEPDPILRAYIASTKHKICSALADRCRLDLDSHLFNDNRWEGYVDPLDLAEVIYGRQD